MPLLIKLLFIILFSSPVLAQVPASMQQKNDPQHGSQPSSIDSIKQLLKAPERKYVPSQQGSIPQQAPQETIEVDNINSLNSALNESETQKNKIEDLENVFDALEQRSNSGLNVEKQPAENIEEIKKENKIVVLDQGGDIWIPKDGPKKSDKNLLRIHYKKDSYSLSDADKIAINSMLKLASENNIKNIKIISHSSKRGSHQDEREFSLLRILRLRDYIQQNDNNVENVHYKVMTSSNNKQNIDYIDVDKN